MSEQRPRNILWLNSDHYAYAHHFDLNRTLIKTPAFDRLRAEGVHFAKAYTVCPLCTPARASLVTGQYPHTHGIVNNDGPRVGGSRNAFLPDAPIYAADLREQGYRPALFGKWHATAGGPGTAQDVGFDGWTLPGYGFPYGEEAYRDYLEEMGLPLNPEVVVEWHMRNPDLQGRFPLREIGNRATGLRYHPASGVIDAPPEVHEAYFVAHLAQKYLAERAADGQPFCVRVDPWGPHQPYFVAPPFANTVDPAAITPIPNFSYDLADRPAHHREFQAEILRNSTAVSWEDWRPILARCYEHIALVDNALNGVLDALDRLGLAESTVVLYSADHGDILAAHGGVFDKGWLMVEETMRIPYVVRWPGAASAGTVSDALVSNLDIVATLRDVAGAPPGAQAGGTSLRPLIAPAENDAVWREDLMLESHGHYDRWLIQRMLRWRNWKYVAHLDERDELYDLQSDPYEMHNRSEDPNAQAVLIELRTRLIRQMERTGDEAPDALKLRERLSQQIAVAAPE